MHALQRSHVNESAILDYIDGRGQGRAAVEAHLDECDECRQLVAELARTSLAAGPWGDGTPTEPQRQHGLPQEGALLAGRFRIGKPLGHGAMGMVYEAVDEALGSPIAIKVFWPHLGEDPRVLESIRREASLGRRIQHPSVRRVFDVATTAGITFLTMELVDGETLEARLARGPLSEDEALRMLVQVCDALSAAHGEGIVHRDLKPGNIAIDKNGRVIVMDFGLARDVNAQASRNQGRGLVGTPAYWSPEQARGEPATPASDIYSLGLIAYRLLTDEPFALGGENKLAARYRRVVDRCLEQRPQERYSSAAAARHAFRRAQGSRGLPMVAGVVALAAAVVVAVVAGVIRVQAAAPVARPVPVIAETSPQAAPPAASPAANPKSIESPTVASATPSLPIELLPSASDPRRERGRSAVREARGTVKERPSVIKERPTAPAAARNEPPAAAAAPPPTPDDGSRKTPQRPKRPIDREDPYTKAQ